MKVALLVACLAAVASTVAAMHGQSTVTADGREILAFMHFGFEQGGSIQMDVSYQPGSTMSPVTFLVCSLTKVDELVASTNSLSELCDMNLSKSCEWVDTIDPVNNTLAFNGVAATSDYYEFLLLNCQDSTVELDYSYQFINPGNEHLSTGDIPFKSLTVAFSIAWGLIFLIVGLNYCTNARNSNPLFLALAAVPFAELLASVTSALYWHHVSETGDSPIGWEVIVLGLDSFSQSYLIVVFVLLAKGWHVTRSTMNNVEWRNISCTAIAFFIVFMIFNVLNGFFCLFLLILVYALVLRFIFAAISTNLRVLTWQLRMAFPNGTIDANSLPARQLRAMTVYRSVSPVYVILDMMIRLWSLMALERSPWADEMLVGTCTICTIAFLCFVFRLRRDAPFFRHAARQPLITQPREVVPPVVVINPGGDPATVGVGSNIAIGVPMLPDDDDSCPPRQSHGAVETAPLLGVTVQGSRRSDADSVFSDL